MSLTQEAEIGKSILMAFPNRMIERFFKINSLPKDARRKWMDYLDYHLYSRDPQISWQCEYQTETLTKTESHEIHYFSLLDETIAYEVRQKDPLNRDYFIANVQFESATELEAALRAPHSESVFNQEESMWITPHLAGLPKTHADNLLTNFSYDMDLRTYHLTQVKRISERDGVKKVDSIHFFRLVWLFLGELDRKDPRGKSEGDEFHMFVKRLAKSGVKKEEKLARYSRALLVEFTKTREQMQNLSSSS